jgi:hypothetical protein
MWVWMTAPEASTGERLGVHGANRKMTLLKKKKNNKNVIGPNSKLQINLGYASSIFFNEVLSTIKQKKKSLCTVYFCYRNVVFFKIIF